MFSIRTQWNLTPNRLSDLVSEKRRQSDALIDLTESNPTRCGFTYPRDIILHALADASSLIYNPDPRGLLTARQAIVEYNATRGISLRPEQIVLTTSTSEAYSFLFKLLCDTGDEVLVPRPSYPLFDYLGQVNDITLRQYHLVYDGEWHIDFESLESAYSDRVRAIVLVHPNNPTGSSIQQHEFDKVCSFASKHQCALIIDEVFESYTLDPGKNHLPPLIADASVLSFTLNGISKILGLPQIKLSWIIVQGRASQNEEALNRLDIIADTFLSVSTPAQVALPALLNQLHCLHDQIHERIRNNYRLLDELFASSRVTPLRAESGWYAILQLPQFHSDEDWALALLQQENIFVYPGHFFDMQQRSCLVFSLLPPPEVLADALARLRLLVERS